MNDKQVLKGYEYAKEQYEAVGVDVEAAIAKADSIPVSMHCWQGDDVIGFDGPGELTGGIATTGNYPGRARTPDELRSDIGFAKSMIPGAVQLNIHACYAEKNGKNIDRDEYTIAEFQNWVDFAKELGTGLDFNPTFSPIRKWTAISPSSLNPDTRKFWIEHGKRCNEIAHEFCKQTGKTSVVNYWMPDGYKDICADTKIHRDLMTESSDQIFNSSPKSENVVYSIESKLFGVGIESYTVASHEYSYGYALKRGLAYTLDAGHFHPTEVISAKLSACLQFLDKVALHISRGVRWDSDHVIIWDDELQNIMDEIIHNGFEERVYIGLDYFDASINRIACWIIGMRNARKAILNACLAPVESVRKAEREGDYTSRLALMEERRTLPFSAVWDYYCLKKDVGIGREWLDKVKEYERDVLSAR